MTQSSIDIAAENVWKTYQLDDGRTLPVLEGLMREG